MQSQKQQQPFFAFEVEPMPQSIEESRPGIRYLGQFEDIGEADEAASSGGSALWILDGADLKSLKAAIAQAEKEMWNDDGG